MGSAPARTRRTGVLLPSSGSTRTGATSPSSLSRARTRSRGPPPRIRDTTARNHAQRQRHASRAHARAHAGHPRRTGRRRPADDQGDPRLPRYLGGVPAAPPRVARPSHRRPQGRLLLHRGRFGEPQPTALAGPWQRPGDLSGRPPGSGVTQRTHPTPVIAQALDYNPEGAPVAPPRAGGSLLAPG